MAVSSHLVSPSIWTVLGVLLTVSSSIAFPVTSFEMATDRLVDLSHPFNNRTVYWVNSVPAHFILKDIQAGRTWQGHYYRAKRFEAAEHGGTHLDAPSHFSQNGVDAAALRPDSLIGPAVVIKVMEQAAANSDYEVTVDDVKAWEAKHGKIPEGAFVFMNSGWSHYWPNKAAVFGSQTLAETDLHFPSFLPATTTFLIRERKIRGIGSDTPSTDSGQTKTAGSHVALAENGLVGLENVANLDKMPPSGGHVLILPMKIEGGSGTPCRIFGVKPSAS